MAEKRQRKPILSPEDLAGLAKLSQMPEWEILCRVLDNRVMRDKNSIVTYPEHDTIKLATQKSFYRGRIQACYLVKREVNGAARELDRLEEGEPKKKVTKKGKK